MLTVRMKKSLQLLRKSWHKTIEKKVSLKNVPYEFLKEKNCTLLQFFFLCYGSGMKEAGGYEIAKKKGTGDKCLCAT